MAQNTKSNPPIDPDLTHVDNVSVPLVGYGQSVPRRKGGPTSDVEGLARPGHRVAVTARAEDPAGAALSIKTIGGDRARTLRDFETNAPAPYDPLDETQGRSMTVAENRTGLGQSPLWRRRQRDAR
jgi:hypothetical protein